MAGLARRYGLGDAVILHHVADMPTLLAAADVLLFTPRALSGKADIPLTVLEALATGCPVIISDLPQFAALGDAALRVSADDARRAACLLTRLLGEPRWWESVAERGRAAVTARFGPQRFAAQYQDLYQDFLAEAIRQIAADPSLASIRVVILTTFDLDEYVFEAIRSGDELR